MTLSTLLFITVAAGPETKLAMTPIDAGEGTTPKLLGSLTATIVAELQRYPTVSVITYDDVKKVLDQQQTAQLTGCDDPKCYADVGQAMGVSGLVTGAFGKFGKSWLLALKMIDVAGVKVVASGDRRIRSGSLDDVLDAAPELVAELMEQSYGSRIKQQQDDSKSKPAPSASAEFPKGYKDTPLSDQSKKLTYDVFTDGKGHYFARDPNGGLTGDFFAGDKEQLFKQRVSGGGRNGKNYNFVFWEPRVQSRWQGGFNVKDDGIYLQCGDSKVSLEQLSAKKAKKFMKKAELMDVRWQRSALTIARDDLGNYYFVDRLRDGLGKTTYHLFFGPKGRVEHLPLTDAIVDGNGQVFISAQGRFVVKNKGRDSEAFWSVGRAKTDLTLVNLYQHVPMIYGELGAYAGQPLGSACDFVLSPQ